MKVGPRFPIRRFRDVLASVDRRLPVVVARPFRRVIEAIYRNRGRHGAGEILVNQEHAKSAIATLDGVNRQGVHLRRGADKCVADPHHLVNHLDAVVGRLRLVLVVQEART